MDHIFLDGTIDPRQSDLYSAVADYYENPVMTKLKDENGYSMYCVAIYAMLGKDQRYLTVFVTQNRSPIGHTEALAELPWISLITSTLERHTYNVPAHTYRPRRLASLNYEIELKSRQGNNYEYRVKGSLPIVITLIGKKKERNAIEYPNKGNVISALETYQAIVTLQ